MLGAENRGDLLEIIEDRSATRQLPVEKWRDAIGDPTPAEAILEHLVHSAYKINPTGESMRKGCFPARSAYQPSHSPSPVWLKAFGTFIEFPFVP